jgi:hypothetical protein
VQEVQLLWVLQGGKYATSVVKKPTAQVKKRDATKSGGCATIWKPCLAESCYLCTRFMQGTNHLMTFLFILIKNL